MKAETTRTVAPRAIMPLFFVHSTLRNFILCFHLPPLFASQSSLGILLLVRVTLWKLAWYYHNRRPTDRSCTALPRLLRTLIHAHSFTLHFLLLTMFFRRRFFPLVLPGRRGHLVCRRRSWSTGSFADAPGHFT